MRSHIVKIGNSRGIRIPKAFLERTGLDGEVEIVVRDRALVIRHVHRVREGWGEAFAEMAARGDDAFVDEPMEGANSFDDEEWEW